MRFNTDPPRRDHRPWTLGIAFLLTLSLPLLAGCGDAVQGSWEASLTCADLKGMGFWTYYCDPKVSPHKSGWSQTFSVTFSGDRFDYHSVQTNRPALGQSGRYRYDQATGSLELLYTRGDFYFGNWEFDDPHLNHETWRVTLSEDGEQLTAQAGVDSRIMPLVLYGRPATFIRL